MVNLSRRLAKLESAETEERGPRFIVLWDGVYPRPTDEQLAQATRVWEVKMVELQDARLGASH
jgi:hypothetical protein